jgi:hypothetical protein
MSFNRLPYDICSYEHTLAESIGPGAYFLNTPPNACEPCHTTDPYIRLQSHGANVNKKNNLIDIDSELIGITRNNTGCPEKKYIPNPIGNNCRDGVDKVCINLSDNRPIETKNCFDNTEDTRLSNPSCNLRGTGWNRWEWLCKNPQERVTEPFDFQINSRIIAKDNHRACVPNPVNQYNVFPDVDDTPICDNIIKVCSVPTGPPSTQWRSVQTINNY